MFIFHSFDEQNHELISLECEFKDIRVGIYFIDYFFIRYHIDPLLPTTKVHLLITL